MLLVPPIWRPDVQMLTPPWRGRCHQCKGTVPCNETRVVDAAGYYYCTDCGLTMGLLEDDGLTRGRWAAVPLASFM